MNISVNAYAKINLFLDIDSLRNDGYHNIVSYMQTVSLHDVVTVSFSPAATTEINVECDDENIKCDESNLAYKAARAYPFGTGHVRIKIQKNIPISAGLAGGSADAAATLVALNKLFGDKLSSSELKALGAGLGADIPFCIDGGSCLAQGVGDILTPVAPMPECFIVIAKKGEGMSTPLAYLELDKKYNNFIDYSPKNDLLDILLNSQYTAITKEYCDALYNIFEDVVLPIRSDAALIKSLMLENGALGALMSGSGTSVFGIYPSFEGAQCACNKLCCIGAEAFVCQVQK